MNHQQAEQLDITSPVGTLRISSNGSAITAITMLHDTALLYQSTCPVAADAATQIEQYFAGSRRTFELPLAADGTAFQQQVWQALTAIPYGETRTYGWQAQYIGKPTASRAVGAANGRNPLSIVIPCHRVVGANGALTGYAGGVEIKEYLLELEKRS